MRTLLLLIANLVANTGAHISLKLSSRYGGSWRGGDRGCALRRFLAWQVVGNLAAFGGTLAFTALLQGVALHVAYPLTEGLTAIGVQVVGGLVVFREKIPPLAWAGTGLILCGIVLFSL
ncbi:MAG TPA: hypothetical protein VHE79_09430 [Spirochaetia bacterium]